MRLTLQEIRQRAIAFGHDWKDETSERAEAQTFWNEFFNVFGIHRRSVASFERTVRNLAGSYDRIDVIWQGVVIGEHKSRGEGSLESCDPGARYVHCLMRSTATTRFLRHCLRGLTTRPLRRQGRSEPRCHRETQAAGTGSRPWPCPAARRALSRA
jgi:hypothetical protein